MTAKRHLTMAAWAWVLAAAVATGGGPAAGGVASIAMTDDPAPGTGGGQFAWFSPPVINGSGQVAFQAYVGTGSGVFGAGGNGVFSYVRSDDSAPNTGGTFRFFHSPAIDASGGVVFDAYNPSVLYLGGFRADGTSVAALALVGGSAPSPQGGTFQNMEHFCANGAGQAAFNGTVSNNTGGIFRVDGSGTIVGCGRLGDPAPLAVIDSPYLAPSLGKPAINASGQVAFRAGVQNGNYQFHGSGVFRSDGSSIIAYAGSNGVTAAPGGGTFSSFGDPALNSRGEAAFQGFIAGGSNSGIFWGDGVNLSALARTGGAAPGTGGGTFATFGDPAINAASQAAFYATTSLTNNCGIFRAAPGQPAVACARTGDSPPEGNGRFYTFNQTCTVASGGAVAFYAYLEGTAGGYTSGIYLSDGRDTLLVARGDGTLEGTAITNLVMAQGSDQCGTAALNDYGQVAFTANLAGGRQGAFLFSPDALRWREQAGGNWDTLTNWTLGLRPGASADVTITPQNGMTVTGPAGSEKVKSLTLGATGLYQTTSLAMTAGGSLNVTNALTIQSGGTVELTTGTMTAGSVDVTGSLTTAGGTTLTSEYVINRGYAYLGGTTNVSGVLANEGTLATVPESVVQALYLTNSGSMTWDGGTFIGATFTNDYGAALSARGSIFGELVNNGTIDLTGILTVNPGFVTNYGAINVPATRTLRAQGGFDNYGSLVLSGGSVSGAMTNRSGGVVTGNGSISGTLVNEGTVAVDDKQTLTVSQPSDNSGLIALGGAKAILSGGALTNTGTITGQGTLSNSVANTGTIRAETGVLTLGGTSVTNGAGGTIEVLSGATALVSRGLASNAGSIVLRGGTFDNNNRTMTNNGLISGYGTIRTGGLTNATGKSISVGAGDLDVLGPVTNDGRFTTPAGRVTTFYGHVNGTGSFPGTGTVMFLGDFSPGHSPAAVDFGGDLALGDSADLVMELAGRTPGQQYDLLDVAGNLDLGGTLDVVLLGDFQPACGDKFDLLAWGSRSGQFDQVNLPALGGGLSWDLSNFDAAGVISVVPEPATLCLLAAGAIGLLSRRRRSARIAPQT